jgi:polar amino acid transport system substrate-binding protein
VHLFTTRHIIFLSEADELPDVIQICTDAEWPPYDYKDPQNKNKPVGATIDILHEIFKRRNMKIDIKILPWKRCEYRVETGQSHMIIDLSINPEREKKYLISAPLYELKHAFYYKKARYPDGPEIRTVEDVNMFSVGAILGYNLDIYKFDISKVDSGAVTIDRLLKKLRLRYIDLAIGYIEIYQGLAAIGQIDLTGLDYIEIPETPSKQYYVMFTRKKGKGGKQLLKMFNHGLEQLKSEGYYQKVFEKYGIPVE